MKQCSYFELILDKLDNNTNQYDVEVFMQDGGLHHTAKLVKNQVEFCHMVMMPQSGKSPDLNPYENLWVIIRSQIHDQDTSSISPLKKT